MIDSYFAGSARADCALRSELAAGGLPHPQPRASGQLSLHEAGNDVLANNLEPLTFVRSPC
jgi:hypothetical protein